MERYLSWTAQDIANKADWEGGIMELIYWGGPGIFASLGDKAVMFAEMAEYCVDQLKAMLPEPGGEDYE